MTNSGARASTLTGRVDALGVTPDELRAKAHHRLNERIDLTRSKHKPLSLMRQEARRVLDVFLELEVPIWPKTERDRIAEEVIAETPGFSPLDELFRDEANREIMVLAHNQIISRRGDSWMPTSVSFRDPEQYRRILQRMMAAGQAFDGTFTPTVACDVRLANGFRLIAVTPPVVMDQTPIAVFVRGGSDSSKTTAKPATSPITTPAPVSAPPAMSSPGGSASAATQPHADWGIPGRPARGEVGAGSALIGWSSTSRKVDTPIPAAAEQTTRVLSQSGTVVMNPRVPTPAPADPLTKVRQRITERFIQQLASAGIYDVGVIPPAELHKVVALCVAEFNHQERQNLEPVICDQLTLEILAAIQR